MDRETSQPFGAYIRQLRERRGLTLRDVEAAVQGVRLSNSYLYQIERGDRNPPRLAIMKELARVYQVSLEDLSIAAGYHGDSKHVVPVSQVENMNLYQNQIERAYKYVCNDPTFRYGMQAEGDSLSLEAKRFVVELYELLNPNIKLVADSIGESSVSVQEQEGEDDDE